MPTYVKIAFGSANNLRTRVTGFKCRNVARFFFPLHGSWVWCAAQDVPGRPWKGSALAEGRGCRLSEKPESSWCGSWPDVLRRVMGAKGCALASVRASIRQRGNTVRRSHSVCVSDPKVVPPVGYQGQIPYQMVVLSPK